MNPSLRALWADILNAQVETAEEDELDALLPRLRAYANGEPWRDEDVQLVWTSPTARAAYLAERKAVLASLQDRWNDEGLATTFLRRAADSGPTEALVLAERGVTVRALQSSGSEWLISVVLDASASALLPLGTKLRLRDSGGLEWLLGEPDRAGGVDVPWEQESESPLDRLRSFSLHLDFV